MSLREAFGRWTSGPQKQRRRLDDEAERILQRAVQAEDDLVAAERAAGEAKQRQAAAEQEAPRILAGARVEAEQIVGDARREAERLLSDARLVAADRDAIKAEVQELTARRAVLSSEVQALASAKVVLQPAQAV
jgi:cell division septum initiation protein DivIVA